MNWMLVLAGLFVITGLFLTFLGWKKDSVLTIFFGLSFFMIPIFYAVEPIKQFVPFIPPIALGISHFLMKKLKSS